MLQRCWCCKRPVAEGIRIRIVDPGAIEHDVHTKCEKRIRGWSYTVIGVLKNGRIVEKKA